ncbi:MAG: 4Fe-4S binding protein, partial [Opitutales bacterium]|nr:4Fe-4S binding protein [Opitutales bacterium]
MLKTSIEESHCCGCGACAQACPKGALKMSADADGFLYPALDAQKCVNCGLCEKVCPVSESSLKKLAFRRAEKSMAAVSKDKENARESSSGGAFSVLARAFAGNGECAFFGAEALGLFKVEHRAAKNIEDLAAFRKSKYIPSDTKNTFAEAKEILKSGGKVVYSGTPCQIAALKLFVGEKLWENLFCIDFS